MHRRTLLGWSSAIAGSAALRPFAARAQAKLLVYADMHSHIGRLGGPARIREAMAENGMLVIARNIVADGPGQGHTAGAGTRALTV